MHPILFKIGDSTIHTYGLLAAAGWILGIYWWLRQVPHMGLRGGEGEFWRLVYAIVAGAVVGGKLLALVAYLPSFSLDAMLRNFRGGFVYLGGVLGSWIAFYAFCRVKGYASLAKGDFFAGGLALGHALGRLGCLAAGCCHGAPTALPWGIRFTDPESVVPRELLGVAMHPTQLYETAGELAIFFVLTFYFQRRLLAGRLLPGMTWLAYIVMYAVLRFTLDFFRGDDPDFVLGPITASQGISLALVVGSLMYVRRLRAFASASSTGGRGPR